MGISGRWHKHWKQPRRLWSRFNPGLQVRLASAFGAVLVLALAANLLAERRVADVERQLLPRARAVPLSTRLAPPGRALTPKVVLELPDVVTTTAAPELTASLKAYARAVEGRRATGEAAIVMQLESATETLQLRSRQFQTAAAAAPRALRATLRQDLDALQESSVAAVGLADRRRAAWRDYLTAVEVLGNEIRQRLDGAWRIFGRVIARQQMVELRDRVEELRRRAASAAAAETVDTQALVEVEETIAAVLGAPSKDAGVVRMQAALGAARAARASVESIDADEKLAALAREALVAQLQKRVSTIAVEIRKAAEAAQARSAVAVQQAIVPPTPPESSAIPPMSFDEPGAPAEATAAGSSRRRVLLWITVAVLAVTLLISILTVRSLVRQVSRLLDAIRKVSRGESASVGVGGIRELDVLAGEFNAMSSRLAEARRDNARYQTELEHRVSERTAQLHHQATHDPLTELPNRRDLSRLLDEALGAARQQEARVGVFLIDLDHFKLLNDSLGHAFGDRVLVAMAQRLQSVVAPGGFAARLGGDEFTVVTPPMDTLEAITEMGWQLVRAFQRPLLVDSRELMLSVSVGCSVCPDHQDDAEALLQAADAALFRAKAEGRSRLAVYAPEMRDAAAARFSTEQALRRAVDRSEFELVYQPEIELASFDVRMVEALLRWRLPDGRQVSPGEFLAVAEESGLMAEIGDWVLREAVNAAGRWHRGGWNNVRVAVNVSPRQLIDQGFVNRLGDLLAMHEVPSSAIEIELTENVLQTGAPIVRTLEGLREMGIGTALDDFGTGYSSLASLEHLPLTRVKLDRSLIAGIDTNRRSVAIARAILSLCDGLGLEVTAEGIERVAQFQALTPYPSLLLQGFLLSRPLAESAVAEARAVMPEKLAALLLSMPTGIAPPVPRMERVDDLGRTGYL